MSALASRWRVWATWLAPFVVLALVLGWETDWLRAFSRVPAPGEPPVPAPVTVALLPDYQIPGGADALKDTTERTLFNPTRRPAPAALADARRSQMKRGQFQLTGTTVFGEKGIAYLKETAGGKARSVKKGETVNGMLVADVHPDRVRFTLGDESEELILKVAAGPKMTVQPAVPGAAGAPAAAPPTGAQPAAPAVAQALGNAGVAGAQPGQPLSLAERRRAARAAEAAAAQSGASSAAGNAATAPVVNPGATSTWQSMQQRYQQRNPAPAGSTGGP